MNIVSRKELLKPGYQKSDFKIKNYKAAAEGCSGQVAICGQLTDWVIFINGSASSSQLLEDVWQDYITTYPETDISVEEDTVESFNEELDTPTEKAEGTFFMSDIDILTKNGLVRGVVVERGSEIDFVYSYGIFTGNFERDEWGNLVLVFTDGEKIRSEYCKLITDVNKEILKFVTSEKERLQDELIQFQNTIDEKLHEVIFN